MYKYFKKNGYYIMYYRFDSISEYLNYLESTPIRYDLFYNPSSIKKDYDFYYTESFEEAVDLAKYGYHENFDKLKELKLNLEKYVKVSNKKNKQYNFYVGYAPDVKAYLEGSPLSMLNKQNNIRKKIDIYMNSAISAGTSVEKVYNRGAIILNLVEILESLGFSVDFHLFEMTTVYDQMHFSDFILKRDNERLNLQKLYFPLCHPSWVRRLDFRLKEVTPDITYDWVLGYGRPSGLDTIKGVIDLNHNDIIIPTIEELGIRGYDIIDDANRVFDFINSLSEHDFELERVKRIRKMY